jgi:hypothetical protein
MMDGEQNKRQTANGILLIKMDGRLQLSIMIIGSPAMLQIIIEQI